MGDGVEYQYMDQPIPLPPLSDLQPTPKTGRIKIWAVIGIIILLVILGSGGFQTLPCVRGGFRFHNAQKRPAAVKQYPEIKLEFLVNFMERLVKFGLNMLVELV